MKEEEKKKRRERRRRESGHKERAEATNHDDIDNSSNIMAMATPIAI